jgi:hypothetical protein
MPLPITPENFAAVLIAAGTGASAVLTAIGGWALWNKQKEPPPEGSPDALIIAIGQLTKAMDAVHGQFGANLQFFEATLAIVREMAKDTREGTRDMHQVAKDLEELRRIQHDMKDHLGAIRDAINRRGN